MANQKMFVKEQRTFVSVGNSMSTEYKTEEGKVIIRWKGKQKAFPYNIGDYVCISCRGNFPTVSAIKYPRRKGEFLSWFLGFYRNTRAKSLVELDRIVKANSAIYDFNGFQITETYKNKHVKIVRCNRPDCGGTHNLGCYISNDITTDEINDLFFHQWRYSNDIDDYNLITDVLSKNISKLFFFTKFTSNIFTLDVWHGECTEDEAREKIKKEFGYMPTHADFLKLVTEYKNKYDNIYRWNADQMCSIVNPSEDLKIILSKYYGKIPYTKCVNGQHMTFYRD